VKKYDELLNPPCFRSENQLKSPDWQAGRQPRSSLLHHQYPTPTPTRWQKGDRGAPRGPFPMKDPSSSDTQNSGQAKAGTSGCSLRGYSYQKGAQPSVHVYRLSRRGSISAILGDANHLPTQTLCFHSANSRTAPHFLTQPHTRHFPLLNLSPASMRYFIFPPPDPGSNPLVPARTHTLAPYKFIISSSYLLISVLGRREWCFHSTCAIGHLEFISMFNPVPARYTLTFIQRNFLGGYKWMYCA